MDKTFIMHHTGPYVIFGDYLYPAHSSERDNYVARPTPSGCESRLGLLDPIPLPDIERNDVFSRRDEIQRYLELLVLSSLPAMPMDNNTYKDKIDTLAFIVGEVFPLLAETGTEEKLTPEKIVEEILGQKPEEVTVDKRVTELIQRLETKDIPPYLEKMPEPGLAEAAFAGSVHVFPPKDCSLLLRALNYNAVYVADGYAHVLRTKQREGSDRIHIHGRDFFWSRRHRLEWIDEVYVEMARQGFMKDLRANIGTLVQTQQAIPPDKMVYNSLVDKKEFCFRNLTVRWIGAKCYVTLERGPFARQDYECADKWHPRGGFEIGAAMYYNDGILFFGEAPVVKADYKDVAFFTSHIGMFRLLCSQDREQWEKFPINAEGAAQYIRTALDIFYNGFPPENVKGHVGTFGDGRTYREICPLDKAVTAHSLAEVHKLGFLPTNYHIPLEK